MTSTVRPAAVAGTFYPGSPAELGATIDQLLTTARADPAVKAATPKALIVPHAGYIYSGAVAASGFARIAAGADRLDRVVILSPAHRVYVEGLTWPGTSHLRTPLGEIEVDVAAIRELPELVAQPAVHAREEACGCTGINGLACVARRRHLRVEVLDLRNSGDTAGPRDEVVGYGAIALYEEVV